MQNLDQKVFGRDSIYIAMEEEDRANGQQMGGFFSKLKKKFKRVTRKIGKKILPKKVYKSLSKFESKHRKSIKKIGAVAAIAVGGYFAGPKLLSFAKGIGGKSIASTATKKLGGAVLKHQIGKKVSKYQQKKLAKLARQQTPQQFIQNPQVQAISRSVAAQETARAYPTNSRSTRAAQTLLAREGAVEVAHQAEKSTAKEMLKYALPVASAVVVSLIARG